MSDAVEKNPWGGLKAFTNARIALGRAGMVETEAQYLADGQAVAGAAQCDPCRREGFQVNSHGSGISGTWRSSQASNSGAGRRPRTRRR